MDPIAIALALAQFAPGIIKLITGSDKAEVAAAAVVDIAQQATGRPDGVSALAAITASNDARLAFQRAMLESNDKLEAAYLMDRQDARQMQIKAPSPVPAILSFVVTGGYFTILIGMMLGKFSVNDSQALLLMLGSLGTAWGVVISFWFGTTRASQTKDATINNLTR